MAKKAKIIKMQKQQALIERYADQRSALKAAGDYESLAKLPRDSSPVSYTNNRPHETIR